MSKKDPRKAFLRMLRDMRPPSEDMVEPKRINSAETACVARSLADTPTETAHKLRTLAYHELASSSKPDYTFAASSMELREIECTVEPHPQDPGSGFVTGRVALQGKLLHFRSPVKLPEQPARDATELKEKIETQSMSLDALWDFIEERGLMADAVAYCAERDVSTSD